MVDYRTPVEKLDETARFDGSCYPDRTRGEVTVICDKEEANLLSVNLFHEIVTGNLLRMKIMPVKGLRLSRLSNAKNF